MNDVAVLFARRDSVYSGFAVEVFDAERDARTYRGPWPVVAHPPCRGWGRLRHLAKPVEGELDLALFAVEAVRSFGGVLEHPSGSKLWDVAQLPRPGDAPDFWGGWTMRVQQSRWGHGADKWTWLYVVGCPPDLVPELPPPRAGGRLVEHVCVAEREATPPAFAHWLLRLAIKCCP